MSSERVEQSLLPFSAGTINTTVAAKAATTAAPNVTLNGLIERHRHCDWDDDIDDIERSRFDAENGRQTVGHFRLPCGDVIRCETTSDRSRTYVMLASERRVEEVGLVEGYDMWSERYDREPNVLVAVEQPIVDRWVDSLPGPPGSVLDAATGTGRHAFRLSERGWRVTAFDLSPGMLKAAAARFAASGHDVELFQRDLGGGSHEVELSEATFDIVTCGLALSHVSDINRAVLDLARATRPGGTVILTDFHPEAYAIGWRADCHVAGHRYLIPHTAHSREDYLLAVNTAGLSIVEIVDVPLRGAPPGYVSPGGIETVGDQPLCLAIRAVRDESRTEAG